MSVVIALLLGLGVLMVFDSLTRARPSTPRTTPTLMGRCSEWLAASGIGHASPTQFVGASVAVGCAAGAIALVVVGSVAVATVTLVSGTLAPASYYRGRRRVLRSSRRQAWPDAVELLAGAVRTGDTLPGAISVVAERGPDALRPVFGAVLSDHRITGDLVGALERMGATVADPIADRVVTTLVLAHRVGGRELGRVLRTLAEFLREDVATRREIEARQSWTVIAARVSASAPWLVLVLVASRPQGAQAFDSPTGMVVLVAGAGVTMIGYRLMMRLGRLPEEPRVLAPMEPGP